METDEVLGQQDVAHLRIHFRFILGHPQDLGGGESGQCDIPADGDEFLTAEALMDLVALCLGALVVPQDRRAQHLPGLIQQHQPVHLAGQTHRPDALRCRAGFLDDCADGFLCAIPPQVRVLFTP